MRPSLGHTLPPDILASANITLHDVAHHPWEEVSRYPILHMLETEFDGTAPWGYADFESVIENWGKCRQCKTPVPPGAIDALWVCDDRKGDAAYDLRGTYCSPVTARGMDQAVIQSGLNRNELESVPHRVVKRCREFRASDLHYAVARKNAKRAKLLIQQTNQDQTRIQRRGRTWTRLMAEAGLDPASDSLQRLIAPKYTSGVRYCEDQPTIRVTIGRLGSMAKCFPAEMEWLSTARPVFRMAYTEDPALMEFNAGDGGAMLRRAYALREYLRYPFAKDYVVDSKPHQEQLDDLLRVQEDFPDACDLYAETGCPLRYCLWDVTFGRGYRHLGAEHVPETVEELVEEWNEAVRLDGAGAATWARKFRTSDHWRNYRVAGGLDVERRAQLVRELRPVSPENFLAGKVCGTWREVRGALGS